MMTMMSCTVSVRASWDTVQKPSYNPNAPKNPHKTLKPKPSHSVTSTSSTTPSPTLSISPQSVSELLKRNNVKQVKYEESYLGYDTWLPKPPKVEKPRSVFNAATLAYIGDSIYELYARRHFLFPPMNIDECNNRVMAVVRCEAQDALLQKLISDNFLSEEERDILRRGKNIGSAKTKTKKRAGSAVYNRASSLEALVGYLYLTNVNRLDEVMQQLGFSVGSSDKMILDEQSSGQGV